MSQRKRKSQSQMNESSRPSQSSRRGNRSALTQVEDEENYDQYTVATVKFILNHTATKYPIKRADIVKECCNCRTVIFTTILPAVESHLKSIYGITLHEVTSPKSSNKHYICFVENPVSLTKYKKMDSKEQSLLLLMLSYIFVKGTPIVEGVLFNFLERLDINVDNDHFGDVKKSLETFRKQLYLKRVKTVSEISNEEKITLEWGERAFMEFDRKTMLIKIAEAFRKPIVYFKKQVMELRADVIEDTN